MVQRSSKAAIPMAITPTNGAATLTDPELVEQAKAAEREAQKQAAAQQKLTADGDVFDLQLRPEQVAVVVGALTALIGLVSRNKRRYGGYVIHLGALFMILAMVGGIYKDEKEVFRKTWNTTTPRDLM